MLSSATADTTDTACAKCGKAELDDVKLKRCTACKLVKYCCRDCQVAHRPKHKKACKKRAAELFDEELFNDDLPESPECPICMLPLPSDPRLSVFRECCGKSLCLGCVYAQLNENTMNGKQDMGTCAFCRTPDPKSNEDGLDRIKRGV